MIRYRGTGQCRADPGRWRRPSAAEPVKSTVAGPATAPAGRPIAMAMGESSAAAEVRTYVSNDMENPAAGDLKVVTRQAADGAIETIISADVAGNVGILALHQVLVEQAIQG